jgi:hypothetical protein
VRGWKSVVVPVVARRTTHVDGGSLCGVGVGLCRNRRSRSKGATTVNRSDGRKHVENM